MTHFPPHTKRSEVLRPGRRTLLGLACAAVASAAFLLPHGQALAQSAWPTKPVRVVVNFPPGGAADQIARAVSQPLAEVLGQPVVVENRAGAGGNIGGDVVAKSAPDGYTLLMSSGGMVSVNPHIYKTMSFDPAKDLVPVASAARVLVYLMVRPELPSGSAQEFINHVRANPGKLSFGSPGNGSSPHLAGEMFKSQAGLFAVHVPYRGAAPALADLLGGQVDFHFDPGIGLQHAKTGKLKLLAVGSPKRSPAYPDLPTLDEIGLKGFDADTVFGFYAPTGTPPEIIARLNTEINKILATPAFRDRMVALGGDVQIMTPAEFAAKAAEDYKRFGAVIRERGISAN